MPSKRTVFCIVLLLALAGCSTVQVSQDYDPQVDLSGRGTWQWREPVQAPVGDVRIDNPLLDQRIRKAVEAHLTARQMGRSSGSPDFFLRYHLAIAQKIQSDTYYPTIGVRRYGYPWFADVDAETRLRQYDENQLTIDILAADTGKLLWRGTGIYRFKTYATPQAAADDIQQTVDKILLQFPPDGQGN